ncbi:hypothetical protein ABVK25_007741 [Lepraria finkii]|uniref:Uncharacterized protein n=1 Tax=Lepraria finkii TaxID=1340010 RepID=A0ABR4B2B4_9LECA
MATLTALLNELIIAISSNLTIFTSPLSTTVHLPDQRRPLQGGRSPSYNLSRYPTRGSQRPYNKAMATHQPSQHHPSPPPHHQNPRQPSGRRNLQLAPAIAIASNTFRLVTESNVPNSHLVSRWKQISPARLTSVFIARLAKTLATPMAPQ